MIVYLIKSTACLAIFFLFYKLFLEKENMHVFKRFYLLGVLIASFCIPLITFTSYVTVGPIQELELLNQNLMTNIPDDAGLLINYVPIILWTVYGFGVLLFAIKFLVNISKIAIRIHKNPRFKSKSFINVLLEDLAVPHTFFQYIFLDKYKFETQQIPQEVIIHEQTHAKQRHSLDILFIELIQIVCWFNPLVYFLKHSIKLNHEFLADQRVLNQGFDTSNYQKILLNFSSTNHHPQLTNAINYSFIKKRFTIMKTQTSKKTSWLRSLVLLPLLAGLIYGFSDKVTIEKLIPEIQETKNNTTVKDVEIAINKSKEILIYDGNYSIYVTLENLTEEVNKIVSIYDSEQLKNVTAWIQADGTLKMAFITDIKRELRKAGIVHYKQTYTHQDKIAPKSIKLTLEDINKFKLNYTVKATPEQLEEYNKLAKKYNDMSTDKFIVKFKEVERLKYIYSIMSASQKKNAESFPKFPPPPPPPSVPSPERVYKGQKSDVPPPPIPPNPLDHMIELAKKGATFYFVNEKISSDKAIDIVKKNKSINIQVLGHDSKNPIVKLSKKPITVESNSNDQNKWKVTAEPNTKPIVYPKDADFYINDKKVTYREVEKLDRKSIKRTLFKKDKNEFYITTH